MEYGCIGEKLGHSFSKIIHNELCNYEYELKEIPKNALKSFMENKDFKAINVTIPYKQDVIPYLYYIDPIAEKIGAVNTIVNKNGKLYGYNTDFYGMTAMINKNNIILKDKKVLILGTGGTSKTAFAVADSLGAKKIIKVSRKSSDNTVSYEQAEELHKDAQIIINTTPCGMFPEIGYTPIDITKFNNLSGVIDAVYNPLRSKLVTDALNIGINATGGLYMLVAQAFYAAEKFIETDISLSEIERIYIKILKLKENVVFIGMPGSGKTTMGAVLSKQTGKEFIDTDVLIEKDTKISIPEFFKEYGEEKFRIKESQVIYNVSKQQQCIIATGGGAVLNRNNINLLRENGIIIFLDRHLESIMPTNNRPLSSDRDMLVKRYNERYNLYKSSADFIINIKDDVDENLKAIVEVLS